MTTLENRPNTALLVVDVQNGVVEGAHERDAVVANVGSLVEKARRERVPVVWVQHSDDQLAKGSDDWRIVPELTPGDAEPLVEKSYGDSFEDTTLETVLSGLGVGRLVVVGAQTDACVRSTLHGALVRGYDATLVSDAHTTEDLTAWGAPPPDQVIAHTNLYWANQTAPGRTAGTVATKDVDFGRHGLSPLSQDSKREPSSPYGKGEAVGDERSEGEHPTLGARIGAQIASMSFQARLFVRDHSFAVPLTAWTMPSSVWNETAPGPSHRSIPPGTVRGHASPKSACEA